MRKHFLAFFVLLLAAMNIQFVHAAIVKTYAVDKSGLFYCMCEYDTETEKCNVTLKSIDDYYSHPEDIKDLVFPAKVHAKFEQFDGTNDKEDDFEYVIDDSFFSTSEANQLVETITFEEGVKAIPNFFYSRTTDVDEDMYDSYLLTDATVLREVSIPASVESIGVEAFRGHINLEKVTIAGEGLTTIGENAFEAVLTKYMGVPKEFKTKLQPFALPASLETIDEHAFKGQINFKNVTLPKYLKTIGAGAFEGAGIEELTIDECDGIADVTASPFADCPLKKVIFVPREDTYLKVVVPARFFSSINSQFDVEFKDADKDYQSIEFKQQCFYLSHIKSITFPKSFKIAGLPNFAIYFDEQSFDNTFFLKEIDLSAVESEDVIVFAEKCFQYSGLESLKLNDKVAKIGKYAFANTRLVEFTLPQFINSDGDEARMDIYNYAFYKTQNLKAAHILSSVSYDGLDDCLAHSLFYESSIQTVELPASLKKIGDQAFYMSGLTEFTGGENLEQLGDFGSVFAECKDLKTVDLSKTQVKEIGSYMFENTPSMEKCLLPATVDFIRGSAFDGAGLKEFVANASHIESNAFINMPNLEKISFPNELYNEMLEHTILDCPKLKEVDMGHIHRLDKECICGCDALTDLVIGKEVKAIDYDALSCVNTNLKSLTILSNDLSPVATPSDAPFGGATVELILDENVKQLPANIFANGVRVTNNLELRPDLMIDDEAFRDALIDTLDWHYGDDIKFPFLNGAQIGKLTFSELTEVKKELFVGAVIDNLYLDGITKIGEGAFKDAGVMNNGRLHTLFIPASVTEIGVEAFRNLQSFHVVFEKGEGLTIGDEAFAGTLSTVTSRYPKENIPVLGTDVFLNGGGKLNTVFVGSCEDVEAYKVADGWKDIDTWAWDGLQDYKVSVEIVGETNKRPLDYYTYFIKANEYFLDSPINVGCDNKVKLSFDSPCPGSITFDHWADNTTDPSTCTMTITSDTVIRIYVKEKTEKLTLAVKDPEMADQVKFFMFNLTAFDWVEQSEADLNGCSYSDITSFKVELIDGAHYWFNGWYKEDETLYSSNAELDLPYDFTSTKLYADIRVQTYSLNVEVQPMDPSYDLLDHIELNGMDMGKDLIEDIPWQADVELKAVGDKGPGYRYILDYWEDKTDFSHASEDNPWSFKMGDNSLHFSPVMKAAGKYSVTVKTNDDALGEAAMNFDADDKVDDLFWEGAPIQLTAAPKGDHINFVKWNDDAGEQTTWANRTVYVKQDFDYIAIFEKDSFDVVINLLGGVDDKIVEVKGAGRYGWGDEVTLSFTLKDDHYHFEEWTYDSHFYSETTHSFTIEKNMTINAHFNANEYTITVVANPAEGGTVTGAGPAAYMALVTIKAEPNEGYEFTGWEDDGLAPAERQVLVEGDATYTAFFALKQFSVKFMVGEEIVQQDIILYGQHVLSPAADPTKEGYTFVGWKSSISGNVLTPAEVDAEVVTEDVTYTAEFKANPGTGIEEDPMTNDQLPMINKLLRDGRLYIIVNDRVYDSTGKLVK